MNKCQAVKNDGASCKANGCHIVMVWILGVVAYPQDKLPALYANHKWVLQAINVCGAHRNKLIGGKPINIIPITGIDQTFIQEVPNKPEEGNMQYKCDWCEDTGIDPKFWDACKCVTEKGQADPEAPSKKQLAFLDSLVKQIGSEYKVNFTATNKQEASQAIDLLIQVKSLIATLGQHEVTDEQINAVKANLQGNPTIELVKATIKATMKLPKRSDLIDGKIAELLKEIGPKVKVDFTTKTNAEDAINLLELVAQLVKVLRTKTVTADQASNIKARLATKPTIEWVTKAIGHAKTLPNRS